MVVETMVITDDMPVSDIAKSWEETKEVFQKYDISLTSNTTVKEHQQGEQLKLLIAELNKRIGSSEATCIEGG